MKKKRKPMETMKCKNIYCTRHAHEPESCDPDAEYKYDEAPTVCARHPAKSWPHGECIGPGISVDVPLLWKTIDDLVKV